LRSTSLKLYHQPSSCSLSSSISSRIWNTAFQIFLPAAALTAGCLGSSFAFTGYFMALLLAVTAKWRSEQGNERKTWVGENASDTLPPQHYIFVYGTLKKDFHWHHKFLGGWPKQVQYVGNAETVQKHYLIVGRSGVPYLLDIPHHSTSGKRVKGEIWRVNQDILDALDEYEGVTKAYYERKPIHVTNSNIENNLVEAYFLLHEQAKQVIPEETLQNGPFFSEYTLSYHRKHYKPIQHIQVKQDIYLQCPTSRKDRE